MLANMLWSAARGSAQNRSPGVIEPWRATFDLHESGSPDDDPAVVPANPEKLDVVEALRTCNPGGPLGRPN